MDKVQLNVQAWSGADHHCSDGVIENFTMPILDTVDKFNQSKSVTLQGKSGRGRLTLSYGNITTDTTWISTTDPIHVPTTPSTKNGKIYLMLICHVYNFLHLVNFFIKYEYLKSYDLNSSTTIIIIVSNVCIDFC